MKTVFFAVALLFLYSCSDEDRKNQREISTDQGLKAQVGEKLGMQGSLGSNEGFALTDAMPSYSYSQDVVITLKDDLKAQLNIEEVQTDCKASDLQFATVDILTESMNLATTPLMGSFLEIETFDLGLLPKGRNTLHFVISSNSPCSFSLNMTLDATL